MIRDFRPNPHVEPEDYFPFQWPPALGAGLIAGVILMVLPRGNPWAELTYCVSNKPQPVGEVLRPGSTPMWGGLHFINGYSPIRPAGVAREFTTSIHGEINPDVGSYLLNHQAGTDGELALLGVDGIVVAR